MKLVAGLTMIGALGTFPGPRINEQCFEKEWHVVFLPVYKSRTPLADCVEIETDVEQRFGLGTVGPPRCDRPVDVRFIWLRTG